jgi:hypothetical protein
MGTNKIHNKTSAGLEVVARMVQKTVERWTKESPKTYEVITYISTGIFVAALVVPYLPVSPWIISTAAALGMITSKLTVK